MCDVCRRGTAKINIFIPIQSKQSSFTLLILVPLQISFNEVHTKGVRKCLCFECAMPGKTEHLFLSLQLFYRGNTVFFPFQFAVNGEPTSFLAIFQIFAISLEDRFSSHNQMIYRGKETIVHPKID